MDNKIKALILKALIVIGWVVLFSEVFRLVKTARVNLESKIIVLNKLKRNISKKNTQKIIPE